MKMGASGIVRGLVGRGMPQHIAEGFAMNFADESGLNPAINETSPLVPGSRGGYGLSQWTGPRRVALEGFAASRGKPVSDVDVQLDFLMHELSGSEKAAANAIYSTKNASDAAVAIVNKFLRPAEAHRARRAAKYSGNSAQGVADDAMRAVGREPITSMQGAAPMGIFQAMQMPEEKRGGLFNLPESQRDRLRMGLAMMSPQNPNSRFIMAHAQQSMDDRSERREKLEAANATAQWLANNGYEDLAQGVASGALPGNAALGEALARQRAAAAGPDLTTLQKNYQLAQAQGYQGSFMDYQMDLKKAGASSTQVVNNMGAAVEPLGTKGQILVPDPSAPGGYRVEVAEGSEMDREIKSQQEKAGKATEARSQAASIVMDEIDLARELIEGQTTGSPATGITGGLASTIDSTRAGALKNRLATIKANIGFDKLQAMRDASPTGGALGQVSEFENRLLQAVFGSLEQSQKADDLLYNLERLEGIYNRIVHEGIGDDEARALYKDVVRGKGDAPKSKPQAISAAQARAMTPKQAEEYVNGVEDMSSIPSDVLNALIEVMGAQ